METKTDIEVALAFHESALKEVLRKGMSLAVEADALRKENQALKAQVAELAKRVAELSRPADPVAGQ